MKRYTARPHAKERALLRFGIPETQTDSWFSQLMLTARFISSEGIRETYDHKGKRIIIEGDEVVTVFNCIDLPFQGKISELVERELKKAKRALQKKERELSIIIAELTVEKSTLVLKQLKAKSSKVRSTIQMKLDEVNEMLFERRLELDREIDEFKALEMYSAGYVSIGVEAN